MVAKSSSITTKILENVAEAEGVDPADLDPPLGSVIDPDALESLFSSADSTHRYFTFYYKGYEVTIHANKQVSVETDTYSTYHESAALGDD